MAILAKISSEPPCQGGGLIVRYHSKEESAFCPCMGGGVGFDSTKCATINITRVKQIQIAPVSAVEPSPTRAPPAAEGAQLSEVLAKKKVTRLLFGFLMQLALPRRSLRITPGPTGRGNGFALELNWISLSCSTRTTAFVSFYIFDSSMSFIHAGACAFHHFRKEHSPWCWP